MFHRQKNKTKQNKTKQNKKQQKEPTVERLAVETQNTKGALWDAGK
jgi:hypothetical protein